MKQIGIISYGIALPYKRLKVDEIIELWHNMHLEDVKVKMGVLERGVLAQDEDANTLAVQSLKEAFSMVPAADKVEALYYGTCTNPYDSRPSGTMIAEAADQSYTVKCADIQFSTKSGTAALISAAAMVCAGFAQKAAAIGADTINRHVAPGDIQEPCASCGAGTVIVGSEDVIATIDMIESYCSDLSDSFRLEGERYIRMGMFDQPSMLEVGLYAHTIPAAKAAMEKAGLKPQDFAFGVFQQASPAMAYGIGHRLGFTDAQIAPSIFADRIGNTGSASVLIGLAKALEQAKAGDKILLVSYGFGAGADAIVLTVTELAEKYRKQTKTVEEHLAYKTMVDYKTAMKYEYKYIRHTHPSNAFI